ncbi:MAG: carboxymuconolactone decarboxylase family protein, partial [Salinibacterium sp.]|nr:carboxymuconolactone decarboxylase family protein [Salinibacterium sp.]
KAIGMVPNLHRTLAHAPAALSSYVVFSRTMSTGILSPSLREKIAMATASINECGYCASAHAMLGKGAGIPEAEINRNLAAESLEENDAAALAFVRALIDEGGAVEDADLAAVRAAGFGETEIIEIAANVALNGFSNLVNRLARTTIDFPVVNLSHQAN